MYKSSFGGVDMKNGKLLIIDDHKMFASSLSALLKSKEYETDILTLSDAEVIIKHIIMANPVVILLDVHLSQNMSGFDLAEKIMDAKPEQKIIMISGYDFPEFFIKAQSSSVKGFINKAASEHVLIEAIETVKNGGTLFLSPTVNSKDVKQELSESERNILQYLADGLTIDQTAKTMNLAEKTVRNKLQVIYEKLGTNSYLQAVIKGIERGIVKIDI